MLLAQMRRARDPRRLASRPMEFWEVWEQAGISMDMMEEDIEWLF